MVKKIKEYQETLLLIQSFIPQAVLNSARGHELHIRATNVNSEQYDLFLKNDNFIIEGTLQDKRYSTSYNTIFISHKGDFVPCVLSYGELKKTKQIV